MSMENRTYYFPNNKFGRHILSRILRYANGPITSIRKVADTLAVSIVLEKREIIKVERILRRYNLID